VNRVKCMNELLSSPRVVVSRVKPDERQCKLYRFSLPLDRPATVLSARSSSSRTGKVQAGLGFRDRT
jgi:hypothetical protein